MEFRKNWLAILARCRKLTERQDAYYVGKRHRGRVAVKAKELKTGKAHDAFFKNRKRK